MFVQSSLRKTTQNHCQGHFYEGWHPAVWVWIFEEWSEPATELSLKTLGKDQRDACLSSQSYTTSWIELHLPGSTPTSLIVPFQHPQTKERFPDSWRGGVTCGCRWSSLQTPLAPSVLCQKLMDALMSFHNIRIYWITVKFIFSFISWVLLIWLQNWLNWLFLCS